MVKPSKKLKSTTSVITTDGHFQHAVTSLAFSFYLTMISSKLNLLCHICLCRLLETCLLKAERRIQTAVLTACFVLEMSSIWTCRSSISTSMDLRALTAAAQVNSDSSSWNGHRNPGKCGSSVASEELNTKCNFWSYWIICTVTFCNTINWFWPHSRLLNATVVLWFFQRKYSNPVI